MGHIVFPAPPIERFHLLERLTRELRSRGHRTTVLCFDRVEHTFWRAQGVECVRIRPETPTETAAPLPVLAEDDCRRLGRLPRGRALAAVRDRLAALLPGTRRFLQSEAPSLVCLHQRRGSVPRLVQFLARELGQRVVWTGAGLLPGTLQIDDEGLDGASRAARRSAYDYRAVEPDEPFLSSALTGALGRNASPALARRVVQAPPLGERLLDALAALRGEHGHGVLGAIEAYRLALAPMPQLRRRSDLPPSPFAAVLLQTADDERVRLDCPDAPGPVQLTRAALAAVQAPGLGFPLVAVLPPGGLPVGEMSRLRRLAGVRIECADSVHEIAVAAAVVVTIHDHAACTGLLAGTPVVHLGCCSFGVPGVAVRGSLSTLADDLRSALAQEQPELRRRCLTWLLRHGHVWCSPDHPDHNGICGLVLELERRIGDHDPRRMRLYYRAGPAWPLAAEAHT